MVYVYAKQSELNKYIGKKLSILEIKDSLSELGMDIKGESDEKDPELKIEITAEKMDMVSSIGISRAIKFYLGIDSKVKNYKLSNSENKIIVENSNKNPRQKIVSAIIKNAPMSKDFLDEIIKIQEKIHDSFGRNRKKAAIGIYPLSKINFPIYYRARKPEEIKFQILNSQLELNGNEILQNTDIGKKFKHLLDGEKLFPILEDSKKNILSMPPIINSQKTGRVTIEDKDLFIELTGNNLRHLDNILKVLITSFIELGCSAQKVKVEYLDEDYELNLDNTLDTISIDYINKLIGINIKKSEVEKLFNKMQYKVIGISNGIVEFEIPPFRSDVWNDCDVADDIARAYGYNNIIPKFPNISCVGDKLEFTRFRERFNDTLISHGFLELYTYMLSSAKDQFDLMNLKKEDFKFIRLIDSADDGINMIRPMILPENLKSLVINRKNKYPQKIFENGFTMITNNKMENGVDEDVKLSCSIADPKSNYTLIKEILDSIFKLNEITEIEIKEEDFNFLISGRSAKIFHKKKEIGFIGELHPKVLTNFGLIVPVSSFEINLSKIFKNS